MKHAWDGLREIRAAEASASYRRHSSTEVPVKAHVGVFHTWPRREMIIGGAIEKRVLVLPRQPLALITPLQTGHGNDQENRAGTRPRPSYAT